MTGNLTQHYKTGPLTISISFHTQPTCLLTFLVLQLDGSESSTRLIYNAYVKSYTLLQLVDTHTLTHQYIFPICTIVTVTGSSWKHGEALLMGYKCSKDKRRRLALYFSRGA